MGVLDDVLGGFFDPLLGPDRAQRKANRIFGRAPRSPATLTGIKVRTDPESGTTYRWAVEVRPVGGAPFRGSCRQSPGSRRTEVRLGMPVEVAHEAEDVVLCWEDSPPGGWSGRGDVADGIDDSRLPRTGRGEPAEAEVLGFGRVHALGLVAEQRRVRLRVGGEERREKVWVPEYAGHLLAPGTTWPVGLRGDRLDVDWLAALERHGHGVGVPTPDPTDPDEQDVAERLQERALSAVGRLVGADASGAPAEIAFETWVEVSAGLVRDRVPPAEHDAYAQRHGVPAGRWAAEEAAWKGRMMSDWQLGACFGEAYAKALKRR